MQDEVVQTKPVARGVLGPEPDGDLPVHDGEVKVLLALHSVHGRFIETGIEHDSRLLLARVHGAVRTRLLYVPHRSPQAILAIRHLRKRLTDGHVRNLRTDVYPALHIRIARLAGEHGVGLGEEAVVLPPSGAVLETRIDDVGRDVQRMISRGILPPISLRGLRQVARAGQNVCHGGPAVVRHGLCLLHHGLQLCGSDARTIAVGLGSLGKRSLQPATVHFVAKQRHVVHQYFSLIGRTATLQRGKSDSDLSRGLVGHGEDQCVRNPFSYGKALHSRNRGRAATGKPCQQAVSRISRPHIIICSAQTVSALGQGHLLRIDQLHSPTGGQAQRATGRAAITGRRQGSTVVERHLLIVGESAGHGVSGSRFVRPTIDFINHIARHIALQLRPIVERGVKTVVLQEEGGNVRLGHARRS